MQIVKDSRKGACPMQRAEKETFHLTVLLDFSDETCDRVMDFLCCGGHRQVASYRKLYHDGFPNAKDGRQ